MLNTEAADVLREYIRTNKPCNGLQIALETAITALLHQPERQGPRFDSLQCEHCRHITERSSALTCDRCGSADLRPVYVSEIGRKA